MNKILLVIQREYATRVRKPSFWVLTIVVPLLLAAVYAIPIILSAHSTEHVNVLVVDESGLFQQQFQSNNDITYMDAGSLGYAQRQLKEVDSIDAVVYIPARATTIPTDAFLYYRSDKPTMQVQRDVDNQLQVILRNAILLDVNNISEEDYALITGTSIRLHQLDLETGRDGFLQVKIVLAMLLAIIIFFSIFSFGSQVMRGVAEEKSSRIVEVIICSVRPFQLMMGKVVGIGLVGLTQFLLWLLLSAVAVLGIQFSNKDLFEQAQQQVSITQVATKGTDATAQMDALQQQGLVSELMQGLASIDFAAIILTFVFFFIFGYMLYASLFAAIGSLVDADTSEQQYTIPLTLPLMLPVLLMPAMMDAPSGTLSTWLSIIPFTSPIAMMFRIPFGVPYWQLALSMLLLVATFFGGVWLSGRVYKSAILYYGHKISYRDLFRWMRRQSG
ncbi:MAG: ABC transporter permease [Bacteroidales bacterium]|nr:ABC transporter permease [Bacteroidales bacterium]